MIINQEWNVQKHFALCVTLPVQLNVLIFLPQLSAIKKVPLSIPRSQDTRDLCEHRTLRKHFASPSSLAACLFKFILLLKQMFPPLSRCFCCKALTDPRGYASNSLSLPRLSTQNSALQSKWTTRDPTTPPLHYPPPLHYQHQRRLPSSSPPPQATPAPRTVIAASLPLIGEFSTEPACQR